MMMMMMMMRLLLFSCDPGKMNTFKKVLLLLLLALVLSCQGCPEKCTCSSQTVKCQDQDLDSIPQSLPTDTRLLVVTGNNISRIDVGSFPTRLELLTDLHLSGNGIEDVDAMVFHHLPNLLRLDLSNNPIQTLSENALPVDNRLQVLNLSRCFHNHSTVEMDLSGVRNGNLQQLTMLDLSNNDIVVLPDDTFVRMINLVHLNLQNSSIVSILNGTLRVPPLQELDLRDNSIQGIPSGTLMEFNLKPDLDVHLAGNPWRCDCFIEDLLSWLKNSSRVGDVQNLTCSEPERLRGRRLVQVKPSQLKCYGNMEGVLETSYVFLGLVLALIGVIFLLVLYLNRKGIKRWMYNFRDACRDHMEGYHYRYEINTDPRLANLSINSDV